uniref:Uncharacterized protein n=1 Tax=Anguilla anguilla TaxID=7936 RepID=A0A0E9PJW4_ANGAN
MISFDDTESGVKDMLKLLNPQRSFMLNLFVEELMCELHGSLEWPFRP